MQEMDDLAHAKAQDVAVMGRLINFVISGDDNPK